MSDGPVFDAAPSEAWSVTPTVPDEKSAYNPAFSQPVVAGDGLYVAKELRFGPNQPGPEYHVLQCRNAETGDERWSYELTAVPTDPAVDDDAVLVGAGETLHAVDRDDGAEQWTREFPSSVEAVVPGAELTYVALDEEIHALTAGGETQWTIPFEERVTARPAMGPQALYVGTVDGSIHAVAPGGSRQWTETTLREGYENDDAPSVDNVVATDCGAFAVTDGDIYAFDAEGAFAWHAGEAYWGLATDGRRLYAGTSGGYFRGIDAATGEREWEQFYGIEDRRYTDGIYRNPVVTDGAVYAFARPDTLIALDPASGDELWTMTGRVTDLAVAGERLYGTRKRDGDLVAMRSE